eukprot:4141611-Pyramimonas_sp.AAC.1
MAASTFRLARRQKEGQAAGKFDEWDSQYAEAKVQGLIDRCPSLLPCKPALQPLPSSAMDAFEVLFDLSEKARFISAFASENSRSSHMSGVLLRDWAHKNRVIQHDDQPAWRERDRECGHG